MSDTLPAYPNGEVTVRQEFRIGDFPEQPYIPMLPTMPWQPPVYPWEQPSIPAEDWKRYWDSTETTDTIKLFKEFFTKTQASEPTLQDVQDMIEEECDAIKELLLEKNRKYGNSALSPSRIFSQSDPVEQIKVRIDDKLTRMKNMQGDETEDVVQDLMGYLVLLRIAQRLADNADVEEGSDLSEDRE